MVSGQSSQTENTFDDPTQDRIVVGVDGSEESREALRWALRYAEMTGACVDVVHAWHIADERAWLQSMPPPALPTDVAHKALEAMVSDLVRPGSSLAVSSEIREGHAVRVLVDASKEASMLVVGSRGFYGLDGVLIGSVSAQCAAHAPCTVVVVRPNRDS